MKIIKRNGSEAVFDITKIIAAITKANKVVPDAQRLTKQQIIEISDHVQEVCYARGHAMNVEEIQDIVHAFGDSALRVKRAVLTLVEIHGALGYLLTNFFSPTTNHRTDLYCGSLEHRTPIYRVLVRDVRKQVGPDFPVTMSPIGQDC